MKDKKTTKKKNYSLKVGEIVDIRIKEIPLMRECKILKASDYVLAFEYRGQEYLIHTYSVIFIRR